MQVKPSVPLFMRCHQGNLNSWMSKMKVQKFRATAFVKQNSPSVARINYQTMQDRHKKSM